jgi:hypothetical protein
MLLLTEVVNGANELINGANELMYHLLTIY